MPIARFQLPDGRVARFEVPDGTTPEQAQTMMEAHFSKAEQPAEVNPPPVQNQSPAPVEKQGRLDRYLKGVKDPIDAGAQMLVHALPDGVVKAGNSLNNWIADKTGLVARLPEGGIDQQIAESEKAYQAQRSAAGESGIDGYRSIGNIINPANIALGYMTGGAAPASMAGRVLAGGAMGVGSGALAPVTEGDFSSEKLKQVSVGGGVGAALPFVGAAASRVISPKVSDSVKQLLDNKITPTAGQILGGGWQKLEDKLTSVPLLGDAISSARSKSLNEFNRAAYAKALAPIGGTVPKEAGRDAVASIRTQLGEKYDQLLPKLVFKPDQQFSDEFQSLQAMAKNLAPQEAKKFESILNEHLSKVSPNGGMEGETFKILEGALNRDAKRFSSSLDPYQQELGDSLRQALQVFRDGLARSNPAHAKELADINQGYANYVRIRDAASRQGSADGKFTPAQLSAAVRAQDKTVGKRAFSEGDALMQDLSDAGKASLSSQYPDSGTAGRLLASALTGGAAAGAATVNPLSVALAGLTTIPYLPGGRNFVASLLAKRPDAAKPIADAVRQYSPAITAGILPAISGN